MFLFLHSNDSMALLKNTHIHTHTHLEIKKWKKLSSSVWKNAYDCPDETFQKTNSQFLYILGGVHKRLLRDSYMCGFSRTLKIIL